MRISDKTFLAMVGIDNALTQEQIDTLKEEGEKTHAPLQTLAVRKELLTNDKIAKLFSDYTKIPYVELDPKTIPPEALNKIPQHIA